jgi:O-antigen/teichoic acid export membrane protein
MKLIENSFYNLLGTLLPLVVAVVTVPIYVRTIGPERYGALAIAWLFLGYFSQADFGIGRAITQRIATLRQATPQARAQCVWSGFAAITSIGVVSGLATYGAGYFFFADVFKVGADLRVELMASLWLLGLATPVISLYGVASGSLLGMERFKLVSVASVASTSALQILPLIAARYVGNNLDVLIGASVLARFLGFLLQLWGVWRVVLRGQQMMVERKEFFALLKFGKWVMISAMVSPLMTFFDRFAIGATLGPAAVAAYSIPNQIASRSLMLPMAITQALFPRFSASTPETARQQCADFTEITALGFAPFMIAGICLSEPLLRLWLGGALDPRSVFIAQIILAGYWINGVANLPFAFVQGSGKPHRAALLHLAELPCYLVVVLLLGRSFGLAGIAAAFSLRCLVDYLALCASAQGFWTGLRGTIASAIPLVIALVLHDHLHSWSDALIGAFILGGASAVWAAWRLWRSWPIDAGFEPVHQI